MTLFEYIVIALALSLNTMIVMRTCATTCKIRLSRALLHMAMTAAIYVALTALGLTLGNMLRFEAADIPEAYRQVNSLIYLGLVAVVALKLSLGIWKKKREEPTYDISRTSTAFALAMATGVNVLLIALGAGFVADVERDLCKAAIPIATLTLLLGYWGIMLGRRQTAIRERRWLVVAILMLLATAIFRTVEL